jgi:hypothetical protein
MISMLLQLFLTFMIGIGSSLVAGQGITFIRIDSLLQIATRYVLIGCIYSIFAKDYASLSMNLSFIW